MEKHLKGIFKIDKPLFWKIIDLILSKELMQSKHMYQSNINIASIFMAWALGYNSKEQVLLAITNCLPRIEFGYGSFVWQ